MKMSSVSKSSVFIAGGKVGKWESEIGPPALLPTLSLSHLLTFGLMRFRSSLPASAVVRGSRRLRRRHVFDEQWNARLGLSVQRDVHGVKARLVEFQLLKVDDEIARAKVHILRQRNLHGNRRKVLRHDRMAVGIHEVEAEVVLAFITAEERDAQGHGALRVGGG